MRALALLISVPLLAACDLNPLMGEPSEFQRYHERLSAVEAKLAAPVVASVATVEEPVVVPQPTPEPIPTPEPEPAECVAIFRVLSCGDNGEFFWL